MGLIRYSKQIHLNPYIKMLKLNHKKLKIWEKGLILIKEIYVLTEYLPPEEKFGLTNQMRRAAVSILSNISEGASRSSQRERKRFYEISRSSLVELDTQMEILLTLGFATKERIREPSKILGEVFAMLSVMKANT